MSRRRLRWKLRCRAFQARWNLCFLPRAIGSMQHDVRNRIAHEYLPDELAKIYASLVGSAATEFHWLRERFGKVA